MSKQTLQTNIYSGIVEEFVKVNGVWTLDIRVRIPTVHGFSSQSGVKTSDLPIASPILPAGFASDKEDFMNQILRERKVMVMFDGGDNSKPLYFGVVHSGKTVGQRLVEFYDSTSNFPAIETNPNSSTLYVARDSHMIYLFNTSISDYEPIVDMAFIGDILSGTTNFFTTLDIGGIDASTQVIDGISATVGNTCLMANGSQRRIFQWTSGGFWTSTYSPLATGNVYSIENGLQYAGYMVKVLNSAPWYMVVKKSENNKWQSVA